MEEWLMRPVGFVRTQYQDTSQIPKGPGAEHTAEGTLEILPKFEGGLQDIEGFSHLFVLWIFHRAQGYELVLLLLVVGEWINLRAVLVNASPASISSSVSDTVLRLRLSCS